MNDVKPKLYEVRYAYPTSPNAEEYGCPESGCYLVQSSQSGRVVSGPYDERIEALEALERIDPEAIVIEPAPRASLPVSHALMMADAPEMRRKLARIREQLNRVNVNAEEIVQDIEDVLDS